MWISWFDVLVFNSQWRYYNWINQHFQDYSSNDTFIQNEQKMTNTILFPICFPEFGFEIIKSPGHTPRFAGNGVFDYDCVFSKKTHTIHNPPSK